MYILVNFWRVDYLLDTICDNVPIKGRGYVSVSLSHSLSSHAPSPFSFLLSRTLISLLLWSFLVLSVLCPFLSSPLAQVGLGGNSSVRTTTLRTRSHTRHGVDSSRGKTGSTEGGKIDLWVEGSQVQV